MRRLSFVVVLFVLAGCGGSGGSGSGPAAGTSLRAMFSQTTSTPDLKDGFEYGDSKYIRTTWTTKDREHQLLGYGASDLLREGPQFGTDPLAADVGFAIGEPPHRATLVRGGATSTDGVKATLEKAGAKPAKVAGHDGLAWGAEGSIHVQGADPVNPIGATGELDRVILGGGTLIAGRYEAEVAALAGEGDGSLLDNGTFKAYADCLGDVIAAQGSDTVIGPVATGVRRPSDPQAPLTEVLCVAGDRLDDAESNLKRFQSPNMTLRSTRQPVSDLWSKIAVDRGDGFVRGTFVDAADTPPGVLAQALERGEFFPGG